MDIVEAFLPLGRFFGGFGAVVAWAIFEVLLGLVVLGAALTVALVVKVIRSLL